MQVMNGGEYDQKNVLVGQAGKTQGFGVTNDPILMSMLSTGLYGNPLRTMLQEIMFNAWDAHRMGNCQDRPIDVYLNETTGLIVRDYGPGIAPDQMHSIYCIYGNSTKRADSNMTGGFGLGSKSPYAYNDSFTVTSHHKQKKSMYLMNRVSKDNDGGPGMTPIIEGVPTEECGLLVTVPLKNDRDLKRSYEFIKDIAYLSGMKINLHYEDKEPETIESDSVEPGKWILDDEHNHGLWAVYGGVRYEIPEDDHYIAEYQFLRKVAGQLGRMYIGFKPNSLTPLPNREGLNLNERTTESIKEQLETIEEVFRQMLIPATRVMINETMRFFKDSDIQAPFLGQHWANVGDHKSLKDIVVQQTEIMEAAAAARPENAEIPQSMWNSLCHMIFTHSSRIVEMLGKEKWNQMMYIVWAKNFPQHRDYRDHIMYEGKRGTRSPYKSINSIELPKSMKQIITAAKIAKDATGQDMNIRILHGDQWLEVMNIRGAGKPTQLDWRQKDILKALARDGVEIPHSKREYPDRLWFKKNGEEVKNMMMQGVIIVSKTLAALKKTGWNTQAIFTPKFGTVGNYHPFYHSNFGQHYYGRIGFPVAALIVHQKNGDYDKAVEALKKAGYDVLEADAPEKRTYVKKVVDGTPVAKSTITYPLFDLQQSDWAGLEEVENPTCYLNITAHKIQHEYSSNLPSKFLLNVVKESTPRFVILHSKARVGRLEKKKIPSFQDKLHTIVAKIIVNEERLRKIMLFNYLHEHSNLPEEIIAIPEMQKIFGVPYIRTKEKESFERDWKILKHVNDARYRNWIETSTRQMVRDAFEKAKLDPLFSSVRSMCQKSSFFDNYQLQTAVRSMKPEEQKMFAQKIARFIRTV